MDTMDIPETNALNLAFNFTFYYICWFKKKLSKHNNKGSSTYPYG